MKFIIEMDSVELMDAIGSGALTALLKGADVQPEIKTGADAQQQTPSIPKEPAAVVPVQQPEDPAVPLQGPADPVLTTQEPVAEPVTPVTTTAREYTLDELASAAMPLLDKGMQPQLQELLKRFGVEAMPQLPKEQYGAFATSLRGLGAQI